MENALFFMKAPAEVWMGCVSGDRGAQAGDGRAQRVFPRWRDDAKRSAMSAQSSTELAGRRARAG